MGLEREWGKNNKAGGQSYKHIYARKLRLMGRNMRYFPVRYDSRVIIYKRKMFIRLATGLVLGLRPDLNKKCTPEVN